MPGDKDRHLDMIARGERVLLRKWQVSDCDHFVRWMSRGEWRQFGAPWEEFPPTGMPEDEKSNRAWFLQQLAREDRCWLSGGAVIATLDDIPIGWVTHYGGQDGPGVIFVGIDISLHRCVRFDVWAKHPGPAIVRCVWLSSGPNPLLGVGLGGMRRPYKATTEAEAEK